MKGMYTWFNRDNNIKIYATTEQAKQYEKENKVKLTRGGKIISVQ